MPSVRTTYPASRLSPVPVKSRKIVQIAATETKQQAPFHRAVTQIREEAFAEQQAVNNTLKQIRPAPPQPKEEKITMTRSVSQDEIPGEKMLFDTSSEKKF